MALVGDTGLRAPSANFDVLRPSRLEEMSDTLSVTGLIVRVTFTVDLLTSKSVHGSLV